MSSPNPSMTAATDSDPNMEWQGNVAPVTVPVSRGRVSRVALEEWLIGLVCLTIDVISWIAIYGTITFLRRDQFLVGPFEFLLVDVIQLTFICQALFMIGGYDRKNDTRTLTYMA